MFIQVFLGSCDLNMYANGTWQICRMIFVPFRLSCDISAKQVGIVMKIVLF